MTIRVLYKDNTYDIISAFTLQRLIESQKIRMFYRYSEKRWVAIGQEPIRKRMHRDYYSGPERRMADSVALQTA